MAVKRAKPAKRDKPVKRAAPVKPAKRARPAKPAKPAKRTRPAAPSAPDLAAIASLLGDARGPWDALLSHIAEACPAATLEWKYYGDKYGWQLKVTLGKNALCYLIPHEGSFTAATALAETSIPALRKSGLPPGLVQEIVDGRTLPEGRAARIDVTSVRQLEVVRMLLAIKLSAP